MPGPEPLPDAEWKSGDAAREGEIRIAVAMGIYVVSSLLAIQVLRIEVGDDIDTRVLRVLYAIALAGLAPLWLVFAPTLISRLIACTACLILTLIWMPVWILCVSSAIVGGFFVAAILLTIPAASVYYATIRLVSSVRQFWKSRARHSPSA